MTLMVKEVKEETRYLTLEEHCMFSVQANDEYRFADDYVETVHNELFNNHGFVKFVYDGDTKQYGKTELYKGLFRKVSVRPATINESRAYYYLKCVGMRECDGSCVTCPLSTHCISYTSLRDECIKIIAGKEFFEA